MNVNEHHPQPASAMPDAYDRLLGALHGLPDVTRTRETTIRTVPPLGIGGSQVFILQTYRQREVGDTCFLECVGAGGAVRLVLPPSVTAAIARQRDALTSKVRRKTAKASALDRKARGIAPGFLKIARTAKRGRKRAAKPTGEVAVP
jgi:hypothetical protein